METKTIGITVLVLLGLIGSLNVDFDKTYFCESRNIIKECSRFSSSGLRCYPELTTTKGYKDCKEGWKLIVNDQEIKLHSKGIEYLCNVNGSCEVKT